MTDMTSINIDSIDLDNVVDEATAGEPVFQEDTGLESMADDLESTDEAGYQVFEPLSEELSLFGKVEAILFASPKPLRTVEIHELLMELGYTLKEIQDSLDELAEFYRDRGGGFHLKYVKRMGYQFQTTSAAKSLMEKQFSSRPRPLSRAALETLAVVAYRQKSQKSGVTRAEVEFIRGVDAGSIFKALVERNLLTCVGRKEIPGRPMMFGITDEFLKIFQLGSISDLPPLESFQTPVDVITAANEKIAAFEAEQDGVNPEEFVGDELYTESLGDSQDDILGVEAPAFAPSSPEHSPEHSPGLSLGMSSELLAEIAEETLSEMNDEEKLLAMEADQENAVPQDAILAIPDELATPFEAPNKSSDDRDDI
jgi:segregation and condensation protein B